jgi:cell division septation protein DedD
MEYGKIIAVTGLPGLYELLTSKSDGAIVRSLDDQSTKFVASRVHNFSHLESIEVYTVRENVNLSEVFNAMEKSEEKLPDGKDGSALKKYFEKVYPDLDFERVYTSDLKKMAKWFEILTQNNIEIKLSAEQGGDEDEGEGDEKIEEPNTTPAPPPVEEPTEEKPKKAAKKKAAPAQAESAAEEPSEKPAKKTARKKKAEE